MMQEKINVLFVCMGNICRSPMAEGVFRHMVAQDGMTQHISTDSAGTHAYHIGEPPDHRAQATLVNHGVDISDLRARKVTTNDFSKFHYILAMDHENLSILQTVCPGDYKDRVRLFLEFAPQTRQAVIPDPYYGGQQGFNRVYELVDAASRGLLTQIRQRFLE